MLSIAERHKSILDALQKQGYIRVADIAAQLGVTVVTVRKDFKELEKRGLLYRTHGSASPVNPHVPDRSVFAKEQINRDKKEKIGRAAARLIEPNDSVIIASGSTICTFAEHIHPTGHLDVVTPSLSVAMHLSQIDGDINVIQLGGTVDKKSLSVRGAYAALEVFDFFSSSKLFFGADGIDEEHGVTTSNLEEVLLTRRMMKAAARNILLADSSKFTKQGFGKICTLEQIDTLVTDELAPAAIVRQLEEQGIEVIIAQ